MRHPTKQIVAFRSGRMRHLSALALALSVLVCSSVLAQRPDIDFTENLGGPSFSLDWAQFRADSSSLTRLEVYYKIPNSGLSFVAVDSGYEAGYEITISLLKKNTREGHEEIRRKKFVRDFERTTLYSDFVLNVVEFDIKPGKYKLAVNLTDLKSELQRKTDKKIKIIDLKPGREPKLSALEFLYSADFSEQDVSFFRKGDVTVVPAVDRTVEGGKEGGPILFYFEVYPGRDKSLNALIDTRIRSRTHGQVYRDTVYVRMDEPVNRQVRQINLDDFRPGSYDVSVTLIGRKKKSVDRQKGAFQINWSLLGMVKHDYKTIISQLESIGDHGEMKELKKAETVEARLAAWKEFWDSRDPTPDTKENEALTSFYYRVRYANRFFSAPKRDGWRSDRGMILLRYGTPDESFDDPVSPSNAAVQIWFYYNYDGEPLRFVFVDEFGDGDFRQQYPYDGRLR
ncbi:MAG: GWxTD domain-containing protein [Candidatus Zixiibacteriota bacterium]